MTLSSLPPALQELLDSVPETETLVSGETVRFTAGDTEFEGYLAYPAGNDTIPKPGILVIHDWNGTSDHVKVRAEMLARLGYVALAADIYGAGVRPASSDEAAAQAGQFYGDNVLFRSRLLGNLERLTSDSRVDSTRIGVIGYCFGGSGALEIARSGADIAAVVSFHGGLGSSHPAARGQITAPILVLTGAEDPVVPPADLTAFEDEMRTAQVTDWQVITYSRAMHAFAIPDTDFPELGAQFQPTANRRSWAAMESFLAETLA